MIYESIKEKLYKEFCNSIGRGYNDGDIYDFRYKADTTYKDSRNNVKGFKDKKTFIEHHKNYYKTTTEDIDVNRKGKSNCFGGLYLIGVNENILDEILVRILEAAWEDSEK